MHIKRMHEMVECLTECTESAIKADETCVGQYPIGDVVDMIKDLSEAEYYAKITKAMDESDLEDTMEMFDRYGDGYRRYYDHYRYKNGKFAPKGSGTYRRNYGEPPYYRMTPELYHDMESRRDMDRDSRHRMYYTEPSTDGMETMNESNYEKKKRNYTETKELHHANTPEDKKKNMESLESYMVELSKDVSGMMSDMTPEEKELAKRKLMALANKIQ